MSKYECASVNLEHERQNSLKWTKYIHHTHTHKHTRLQQQFDTYGIRVVDNANESFKTKVAVYMRAHIDISLDVRMDFHAWQML